MNTTTTLQQHVAKIQEYMAQGKALEAMKEFYADNVTMIETDGTVTVGLEENLKREMEFFSKVTEFKKNDFVDAVCAGTPDAGTVITVVDSVYTHADYGEIMGHQASVTTWKDGKVVHEVFYLDSDK